MRSLLTSTVLAGLVFGAASAEAKVADITFSGTGFTEASGLLAGLPALSWAGTVTIDLDAVDTDDSEERGAYNSALNALSFRLPLLGIDFTTTEDEPLTEILVSGSTRSLSLVNVAVDGGVEVNTSFALNDLGSVFNPIDDTLPQTDADFFAFDTLSFTFAFADLGGAGALLGGFTAVPTLASLDIHAPLPAALPLFGAGLAAFAYARHRRAKRTA